MLLPALMYIFFGVQMASLAAQINTAPLPAPLPEWQKAAGGKLEFEVAAVRLSKPGTPWKSNVVLNGRDGPAPVGNLLTANSNLLSYIVFAYKITDVSQFRELNSQLPEWAHTDGLDIEARSETTPTRDQLRLMVQSLLADRLKLAMHVETRKHPVFALTLIKPGELGPQLHPHPANKPCINPASMPSQPLAAGAHPLYCGSSVWNSGGQMHLRMVDVTMDRTAGYLSTWAVEAGEAVEPHVGVDRTGLSGSFDLDSEFVPHSTGPGSEADVAGPTFAGALRNQLGLKLVEEKGLVSIFVIDHIERPSPN